MSDKKPEAPPGGDKAADKTAAPVAASGGGGIKALLPAIIAIVLAPAATWAVAQFVLLPKFRESLAAAVADPKAGAATAKAAKPEKAAAHGGGHGKGEKPSEPAGYRFEGIVVNLAGTMGTRYLKASFLVTSEDPNLTASFDAAKPQLGDVTLAVLSSLSLADLEEPGSKNIIRERLLAAYNQALGQKIAENLYFSEFVVQ
jgi:flagellar protein FliL